MKGCGPGSLGAMLGSVAAFAIVNGLGYAISGDNPSYGSAQGAAALYFMLSLPALPVGMVLGAATGRLVTRLRNRRG